MPLVLIILASANTNGAVSNVLGQTAVVNVFSAGMSVETVTSMSSHSVPEILTAIIKADSGIVTEKVLSSVQCVMPLITIWLSFSGIASSHVIDFVFVAKSVVETALVRAISDNKYFINFK